MCSSRNKKQIPIGLFDDKDDEVKKEVPKKGFNDLSSLLGNYTLKDKGGYITREFQDYAYRLAITLNDMKHKSLYMRMAKTIDRKVLDRALSFVADANSAKNKAKLFMWKVKKLREENKQ